MRAIWWSDRFYLTYKSHVRNPLRKTSRPRRQWPQPRARRISKHLAKKHRTVSAKDSFIAADYKSRIHDIHITHSLSSSKIEALNLADFRHSSLYHCQASGKHRVPPNQSCLTQEWTHAYHFGSWPRGKPRRSTHSEGISSGLLGNWQEHKTIKARRVEIGAVPQVVISSVVRVMQHLRRKHLISR